MKKRTYLERSIPIFLAVVLAGCSEQGESKEKNRNIGDAYLRGTLGVAHDVQANVGVMAIDKAVGSFKMQEGKNPASLEELQQKGYLPKIPDAPLGKRFNYDPASGKVSVVEK
jgi:hypothetical protein